MAAMVERELWREAGVEGPLGRPADSVESAFAAAAECRAYMLIDRPSYERLYRGWNLEILFAGDPIMRDSYSVAEAEPRAKAESSGQVFWRWFRSPSGRAAAHYASVKRGGAYKFVTNPSGLKVGFDRGVSPSRR